MKEQNPDRLIEFFSQHTHSPERNDEAMEQTYQKLLYRIDVSQPKVVKFATRHTPFVRWSAAAGIILLVGIGLAIAGVLYYNSLDIPLDSEQSATERTESDDVRYLQYDNTPLNVIVADLSEIYNVPINIKTEGLGKYKLTATFSSDESLEDILSVLAEAGGFSVSYVNGAYLLE